MTLADMHVHSEASKRPSEWFLKKVGASECYTDINSLYAKAKSCGMDFVTVTDHNTIEMGLSLMDKYPEDTFLSVETTTYFPENGCKIHVLIYDITPAIFERIEAVRHDIYRLRDFIRENDLAHSVAHGFYSINKRLDADTLEKLILLFDVFEGRNGARNDYYNETWQRLLKGLTPQHIDALKQKHGIEPMSNDPWIKGFTGGSDDHAGLFIAQTATRCNGAGTKEAFIAQIKAKKAVGIGRCSDYKTFAFSIYKIFCDYSINSKHHAPGGILAFINEVLFEERQSRIRRWITRRKIKKENDANAKILLKFMQDMHGWSWNGPADMEMKLAGTYASMGLLLDEFFKILIESFATDFIRGDIGRLFKTLMSSLPALFISVPFFSALRHLSQDRDLILEMKQKYGKKENPSARKVLWFTDTYNDLNGVSVTINRFKTQILTRNMNVTFVTCSRGDRIKEKNDPGVIYLPTIHSLTPEFYTSYTMRFPSLLASMEMIHEQHPDRIIISTPGPVGVLGLAMAGVLGIECDSIYHTDFAAQAMRIFEDEGMAAFIDSLIHRFYTLSSRIKVPTKEYIQILEKQGYPPEKMSVFRRGITVEPMMASVAWKNSFVSRTISGRA